MLLTICILITVVLLSSRVQANSKFYMGFLLALSMKRMRDGLMKTDYETSSLVEKGNER